MTEPSTLVVARSDQPEDDQAGRHRFKPTTGRFGGLSGIAVLPLGLVAGSVLVGLAGTAGPAFGYLPSIGQNDFSLEPWRQLLAMPGLTRSAALSVGTGLVSTLIALAIVILALAGWWGTRTHAAFVRLLSPLLSIPHAAAAFGLAFLIAPSGWILRVLSPWATGSLRPPDLLTLNDGYGLAMTAGLVAKEVPFLFLVALAAMQQTDPVRALQVSGSLGYGRMKAFLVAVLPRLLPHLRLPALAVAAYASATIDIALILGPTAPPPLAVRVLEWVGRPDLSFRLVAAAGALLQLALTALVLGAVAGVMALLRAAAMGMASNGRRRRGDLVLRLLAAVGMAVPAAVLVASILSLGVWSLAGPWPFPDGLPESWTTAAWRRVGPGLVPVVVDTVLIGLAATGIATVAVVAWLQATTRPGSRPARTWDVLFFVPLVVPEVAYLFGLDVVATGLGVTPGPLTVLIGHLVYVLPYVWLSLSGPWTAFDPIWPRVAASLGAGPFRILLAVQLPMLARPVATAAAIGFAVSVALYLPTLVLGAGRVATVTTETIALSSGADRRTIGVTAFLQGLLPFTGFALAAALPLMVPGLRRLWRAGR